MKKSRKRGFTIVELVIVIAVIAILAAILIPTFSNIIKKSQISADVQLCRNMNTVLANAEAEGRIPGSVYDVLYLENEAGYIIENLNPTAEDMYFAWDQSKNQMIYLMSDLETVYYPEDYTVVPGNCWITVGTAAEAQKVADKGYNLALEKDINEEIVLHNVVSINTLGFKAGNVTFNGDTATKSVETAYMIGQFGEIGGTLGETSIVTSGVATSVNVTSNSAKSSVTVGGYVNSLSVGGSAAASVTSTGLVNSVAATSTASIANSGVVKTIAAGASSTVSGGSNSTENNKVSVGTKEDIESIRTQVASGERNFAKETVELKEDINLAGIAFTPIANISRENVSKDSSAVFAGVFDGKGYEIKNFSTTGFSITGLNAGTNKSTPRFGTAATLYNECVYGLFGVTYDAVIKNVKITCDIDMVLDNANRYVGDSIGGIVGCAYGTITFENCTVNGSIKGYDGVGGFIGRLKGSSATFINCTNNANVTGVRKTGGFIGSSYSGDYSVTYTNCVNNGTITSRGYEGDVAIECRSGSNKDNPGTLMTLEGVDVAAKNFTGYYTASASNGEYLSADENAKNTKVTVNGFTNNGKIYVGSVDVGNGTFYNYETGKMNLK